MRIWYTNIILRMYFSHGACVPAVSIFIPGSWASFPCFCGAHRKLLRSPWNLVVCNLRSIQNSSRLSDGCIFIISRHSRWVFKYFPLGSTITFACIFGIWARKNTTFYFTLSFRCFRLNETVLETTETKQADSQLSFAPKIIEIHLLVFQCFF